MIDPEGAEKFLINVRKMNKAASWQEYIWAYARAIWYVWPFLWTIMILLILLTGIQLYEVLFDG